jgi:hypothetical protein
MELVQCEENLAPPESEAHIKLHVSCMSEIDSFTTAKADRGQKCQKEHNWRHQPQEHPEAHVPVQGQELYNLMVKGEAVPVLKNHGIKTYSEDRGRISHILNLKNRCR